ncbi:MAG TPA: hypothetical protein ENN80_01530 [Candidatus Hydrogenedentes bacterium]|nr:hypothetical protein [Candidatus Hydrogenedentota bacterium]
MRILYVSRHFSRGGYYILERLIADGFDVVGVVLRDEKSPYRNRLRRPFAIGWYRLSCWYYRCEACKFVKSEELLARRHGLRIVKTADINSDEFYAVLETLKPNIMILGGGWPQLIEQRVFDYPAYGSINPHPSLLPAYRGTSVHRWQILDGVEESGMTVLYVEPEFDTGVILGQERVPITIDDTPQDLADKAGRAGAPLVCDVLRRIADLPPGERLEGVLQPESDQPNCRRWKWDEDFLTIDWRQPLRRVYNLIRASNQESYRYRGPIFLAAGHRYLARRAALRPVGDDDARPDAAGVLSIDYEGVHIGRAGDPDVLVITQVQRYDAHHRFRRAFHARKLGKHGLLKSGEILQ